MKVRIKAVCEKHTAFTFINIKSKKEISNKLLTFIRKCVIL